MTLGVSESESFYKTVIMCRKGQAVATYQVATPPVFVSSIPQLSSSLIHLACLKIILFCHA